MILAVSIVAITVNLLAHGHEVKKNAKQVSCVVRTFHKCPSSPSK